MSKAASTTNKNLYIYSRSYETILLGRRNKFSSTIYRYRLVLAGNTVSVKIANGIIDLIWRDRIKPQSGVEETKYLSNISGFPGCGRSSQCQIISFCVRQPHLSI